jgi:hypothetical protein
MRGTRIQKEIEIYATNLANKSKCISTEECERERDEKEGTDVRNTEIKILYIKY